MVSIESIWKDILLIRERGPLVHSITNFVVMNITANALLALGASPVMAHAEEESAAMAACAGALVINIGTLNPGWVNSMKKAMAAAREKNIPVVFDPVGAGATPYRLKTAAELLTLKPTIVRGNASEIAALVHSANSGQAATMKGVDSNQSSETAAAAAKTLSTSCGCVVSLSGKTDYIIDGERQELIHNGHPLMQRVTGIGCCASALTGAFAAVNPAPFAAAAAAMAVIGIAGEIAAKASQGPGSFQPHFLDALYNMREDTIHTLLKAGRME